MSNWPREGVGCSFVTLAPISRATATFKEFSHGNTTVSTKPPSAKGRKGAFSRGIVTLAASELRGARLT